jgi:putative phage-type endonuclease
MDRQMWLEYRRGGIGSSDAPAIMGVSPWRTPFDIWVEKVHGYGQQDENWAMKMGKEKEDIGRCWFEKYMDVDLFPDDYVVHKEVPWIRASLDGIDLDRKILVEIKWPDQETHELAKKKIVPPIYYPQCQHQMLAEGLDTMFYLSCHKDDRAVVEVLRDYEYISSMYATLKLFWDLVVRKVPPALTDRDHKSYDDDMNWNKLTSEYVQAKALADISISHMEEYKKKMIDYAQNRNAKGYGVKLTKSICKGAIDYQKALSDYNEILKEAFPDIVLPPLDLEPYRKSPFTKWSVRQEEQN